MNKAISQQVQAVEAALKQIIQSMPGGGEERPGQRRMARSVTESVRDSRHLVVQAGTGTGKTLAYLLPVVMSGKRTVVTTYTKALQDQMVEEALPSLCDYVASAENRPVSFSEVKGWRNYLCLQRVDEIKRARVPRTA